LYHGSPTLEGTEFDLQKAITKSRRGTGEPGLYLTDDPERAITQFAGPGGTVVRTEVPSSFAQSIKQLDKYGRTEYFVNSQAGTDVLNSGITNVVSQREAIGLWAKGAF
jgi:hypothetical protein